MSVSMSGVTMDPKCLEKYEEMKIKHTLRYIFFKIENKKTIVVAAEGDKSNSYDDFLKALPENEPRYCLADVEYTTKSGAQHSKVVFVFWCPDSGQVREKMLYASSKDSIKKAMLGIQLEIQANDMDDVALADIQKKLMA